MPIDSSAKTKANTTMLNDGYSTKIWMILQEWYESRLAESWLVVAILLVVVHNK